MKKGMKSSGMGGLNTHRAKGMEPPTTMMKTSASKKGVGSKSANKATPGVGSTYAQKGLNKSGGGLTDA